MQFIETPLLVARVFEHVADGPDQLSLRRALGRRGGAEGFAAAALASNGLRWFALRHPDALRERDVHAIVPSGHRAGATLLTPKPRCLYQQRWDLRRRHPIVCNVLISTKGKAFGGCDMDTVRQYHSGHAAHAGYALTIDMGGPHLSEGESTGKHFLRGCWHLTDVTLHSLAGITHLGYGVLSECPALHTVTLSASTSVEHVGRNFCSDCPCLTNVNLSGLRNVKVCEPFFLSNCGSLESINLSVMTSLQRVGGSCLCNCSKLTDVNLSGLRNVWDIGSHFLVNCRSLRSIDLSGMTSVSRINDYFCSGCRALTSLDLTSMRGLYTLGPYFAFRCDSLTLLDASNLSRLCRIGKRFAGECDSLETLRLDGLYNMCGSFPRKLVRGRYTSLTSASITGWSDLKSTGDWFLRGKVRLTVVDLTGMTGVTEIGDSFLATAESLTRIAFSSFTSVRTIGSNFLSRSESLKSVDLSALSSVTDIDSYFLFGSGVSTVDLSGLRSLCFLSTGALGACPHLTSVDVSGLQALRMCGAFLEGFRLPYVSPIGIDKLPAAASDVLLRATDRRVKKQWQTVRDSLLELPGPES